MSSSKKKSKPNILAVGPGSKRLVEFLFDGWIAKIVEIDMEPDPSAHRLKFDIVLTYHVLQKVAFAEAQAALKSWTRCLKHKGELHLFVPSLEWAGEQILAEEPSPILRHHLWGVQQGEGQLHLSGYTMRMLRAMFAKARLNVHQATEGDYVQLSGLDEHVAKHHYIMGVRR